MMKHIVIAVCLFMVPTLMSAQDTYHPPRGLGYGFVGTGTHSMNFTTGLGGEAYVAKGLGMGVELGAAGAGVSPSEDSSKMIGVGSADLSYHFFTERNRGRAAPFVTGGYTTFFGHNAGNGKRPTHGFNVGGGVDLFTTKHLGVRFDIRYFGHGGRILRYAYPDLDQFSFVAFRIGMTFR